MYRSQFANKLGGLSKNVCADLIMAAGLRAKDERLLLAWYVNEMTIHEIAQDENMQIESAYNAIALARKRLLCILKTQTEFLPEGIRKVSEYLVK